MALDFLHILGLPQSSDSQALVLGESSLLIPSSRSGGAVAPVLTAACSGCDLILRLALVFPAGNRVCLSLFPPSPRGRELQGCWRGRGQEGLQDCWAEHAFSWVLCTHLQSGGFPGAPMWDLKRPEDLAQL